MTSYIDGISNKMIITTSGASATSASISVYYGSAGSINIAGLTLAGTGNLISNSSTVAVSIAEGTWYVYIRLTSPSSVVGPLISTASTITSRGYIHANGFVSYSPTTIASVDSFTLSVSLAGYDTVLSGKAAIYYSLSNNDANPTQIGSASPITGGGVVTITSLSIIPYNTYYLYGRTISHKNVEGNLFLSAQQITIRGYKHATAIASYTPITFVDKATTKITLTFTGYDTILSGTASLYYSSQNNDINPTQIGNTSYAIVKGITTIPSFFFSKGTYYIYARTISSKLEQGPLLSLAQQLTIRDYTAPSSFTVSVLTTLYTTVSTSIQLNFSTADGIASANVIAYYDVASNSANPTQLGSGTVDPSGIATIFFTLPVAGNFYIYAKVTAPNGTVGNLLVYNTAFITILDRPSSINFKTFNFASTTDAAAVTTLGPLPTGFSSIAAQANLTSLKSYYRDINGEWAPISKTLVPPMVRCEYNGLSSVGMNLQASGYAVIIIQGSTYRNDNPSVIWSTYPSPSLTKTAMCSAGGNTYVGPSIAPETAITFVSGINSAGELPHGVTRQTQVTFVNARVTGESNRWYNGIKEAVATTAFDGSITQTPSLGAAGGVQLQDFITVHKFSSSMQMSLDSINNTTYTTIGSGTSSTTPYCCTTTTNRSGGARFAEFAVVTENLASDDLLSLANDYANKWRVTFAGPTIKTFRLVNTGTASLSIGYFAFGSKSDMSINLMNNPAYGAATYSVSSGSASSATTWQGSTLRTAPHQIIPAGGYLQIVLNSAIENAGFLQLGLVTFATGAQLVLDINYTSGIWERYDLYYNYGGSVVNTTTTFSDVGSSITIYAKNGVLMPWKQKYRTNPNEDVTMPYSLPLYNISREGNISYLNTLSSNLMAVTWDANRAVNWIISQSRSIGATLTENQVIVFNQHTDASQQAPGSYFGNLKETYGISNTGGHNAKSTTDGLYNLSSIEATRYDYIPLSVQSQYVSYVSRAIDTIDGSVGNRYGLDYVNHAMAFFDPVTLQAMNSVITKNNERLDTNMYLRKSPTGKYFIGTPRTFDAGGTVINSYRGYAGGRLGSQPLNSAVRSMFGLTVDDPSFGNTIDTLDLQKKYTICSYVCNTTMFMSGSADIAPIGDAISIFCTNNGSTTPFVVNLSGSICTDVVIQLGNCIRTPALGAPPSVFGPPKYKALRSCTSSGMANSDIVTYPGSYSQERIFIFTVVIDTTVGGTNFFNDDVTFETYAKCYVNGKRINTSSRRTAGGTNYVTCTTNVGTSPTSYPSYFAQSSSLTYGISQVTDMTVAASGGNPSDSSVIGSGVKYSTASKNSVNSKSFNSFAVPNSRRKYAPWANTLIMLETKTESRSTSIYTSNDVDTHIANLSAKWGIVMAYRWITIKNIGNVDFRFGKLGFYGSATEAGNDAGAGTATDPKTGAYSNIMRGFTSGVSAITSSATIGSGGITAVMSNPYAWNSAGGAAPAVGAATCVTIEPGGYVTIDLGDSITCSHLLFGNFASTGDVTLSRMTVNLTPTLPESESKGIDVPHVLKLAGGSGYFGLYSPEIRADTTAFVNNSGIHYSAGVYLLFSSVWSSVYNPPTSFTYSVGGTVYVSSQTVVSITTSGADATPAAVAVYASTSQTDPVPGQILVCASAGLSATGSASATCVFPTTGTYYLFIKATGPNGTIQSSFVGSSSSAITIISYSLPTSISAATIGTLVVGTSTSAGSQSLTLNGGGNIGALSASNISVYIGAPGNCTVTNYNTSNGVVSFTAKPTVSGMCMLYAIITAPITGSAQTTSLVYTGATSQGFFVDVPSSTYTMPTSFTYSPTNTYVDVTPSNMTVTTSGASSATAPIFVYYGASANVTTLSGLTACGSGTLASNSATISVTIPSGTWYVYVTVTSPLGVLGSILGTASTLSSRAYIQAGSISSFTPLVPVQNANTTFAVTLGGYDTVAQGTASVYYSATTSDTNPTFIGKAALVSGVVTVTGKVPLSSYYLYARTASSLSVEGNLVGSNTILNTRSYNFPTSVSFTNLINYAPTTFTFSPADTLADANVKIYYHATNVSTQPTQCGSGIVNANGSANITCTFPETAVYVYALITSPAGVDDILRCSASSGTPIYGLKRSIIHSGTLSPSVSGTITFTISPTPISNANVKVYYDTITTSSSPTQCGTGTSTGNTATTSCTIPAGGYYLYISLDIDLDKISNYSTSGPIYLRTELQNAVVLSATKTTSGIPIPDVFVDQTTARTFYDLTLGGNVSSYGFIAKFRDNSDPNGIYNTTHGSNGSMIMYTGVSPVNNTPVAPCRTANNPSYQFEWIRWGHTAKVRPNKFFWYTGSYPEWQYGSCELWGYTSKDFVTGATMLWSGTIGPSPSQTSFAFTGGIGNIVGWSHYEIRNTSSATTSWCWAFKLTVLQY